MIDLQYDPDILSYYIRAIAEGSKRNEISLDTLIHLVTSLVSDTDVDFLLKEYTKLYENNRYHTGERDHAFSVLISALTYKQLILAGKEAPIETRDKLINPKNPLKSLATDSQRNHYEFSLDINLFLKEQLAIELKFQEIGQLIADFEEDLTQKKKDIDDEKTQRFQKKKIIKKSLAIIEEYHNKKTTLRDLFKKLNRQYEEAWQISHDTYTGAFLGLFGKVVPLARSLWRFNVALEAKIVDLNNTVLACKKSSFIPLLPKPRTHRSR